MADESEFVYIRPSGDNDSIPGRATRKAFDEIWKAKGFVIMDDDEAGLAMSPETRAEMAGAETTSSTRSKKG